MAMISQNIEKHGYWQGIQKSCVSPLFTIQDMTPFSREFSERHDGAVSSTCWLEFCVL